MRKIKNVLTTSTYLFVKDVNDKFALNIARELKNLVLKT